MITETVLLAGGKGSRLAPLTDTVPKPLLPINNIPTLSHILRKTEQVGIRKATLTLGYLGDLIEKRYQGVFRTMYLTYAREEEPLGTAGGVKAALFPTGLATDLHGVRLSLDGDILVLSGDALFEFDLAAFIRHHEKSGADVTIAAKHLKNVSGYGVMVGDPQRIEAFLEKPDPETTPSHLVNAGVYLMSSRILAEIPQGPYDFGRELFPALIQKGYHLAAFPFEDYWCDIGTPKSYLEANLRASQGESILGRNSQVPPSATVERSVLLDGVTVGQGCQVSDSILAEGVTLADGVSVIASVIGPSCTVSESLPENSLAVLKDGKLTVTPLPIPLVTQEPILL